MNDNSLRDILPLLRPRSAEPTMFTQIVWYTLWVGVAALVILYLYRLYRQRQFRHAQFLAFSQDLGLSAKQTRLVETIARARKLTQPQRLIANAHAFERQVGAYAQDLAQRKYRHPRLRQIARLRQDLGFDQLPVDQALTSTRQIDRGQTLMLSQIDAQPHQEHPVPWLVMEFDEASLELSPLLRDGADHHETHSYRRGDELSVCFWREGDTEYRFHTKVVSVDGQNLVVLHAASVERLQHRGFFRIRVNFPVDLFALPAGDGEPQDDQAGQQADTAQAAAVALLNRETGETPTDEPPLPASAIEFRDGVIPPAARRLHGRVQDLSAGGLALLIEQNALPREEGLIWLIDPTFDGDFPLAAVLCETVSSEPERGQILMKMRFRELPSTVEKQIIQRIYQIQLDHAGGAPPPSRGNDPQGSGTPRGEGEAHDLAADVTSEDDIEGATGEASPHRDASTSEDSGP